MKKIIYAIIISTMSAVASYAEDPSNTNSNTDSAPQVSTGAAEDSKDPHWCLVNNEGGISCYTSTGEQIEGLKTEIYFAPMKQLNEQSWLNAGHWVGLQNAGRWVGSIIVKGFMVTSVAVAMGHLLLLVAPRN